MDPNNGAVTLRVPAAAPFIRVPRLVAASLANDAGFDVEALDDIRLAVGEACSIAVLAGAGTIDLEFTLAERRLEASGTSTLTAPAEPREVEHQELVAQILGVACADHRIDRNGSALTFWMAFTHDH